MANPQILSLTVPNWKHGDGNFRLKIFVEKNFFSTSGGQVSSALGNYYEAAAVASGGICTTSPITIPTTTDALDDQSVRYKRAAIYKNSRKLHTIIENFALPAEFVPTTSFAQIAIYNNDLVAFQDISGYTKTQVDALIYDALNGVLLAPGTNLNYGQTKFDVLPVGEAVAVGVNSPRISKVLSADYGNSFATAITEIGGDDVNLLVKENVAFAASFEIPENINIEFENGAQITTSGAAQVNINKMRDPGNVKVFGGTGKVVLKRGAVEELNLAWWTGVEDETDITAGMNAALFSLTSTFGGQLFIPQQLTLLSDGGHILPQNSTIRGAGISATNIKLKGGAEYWVKISDNCQYSAISDITITAEEINVPVGILVEGTSPLSAKNNRISRVLFDNLATGIDIGTAAGSEFAWEAMKLVIEECSFQLNETGIKINTINSGIDIDRCFHYPKPGGTAIEAAAVGTLRISGCTPVFGSGTPVANVPQTDGSTFLKINGQHNIIGLDGVQDENVQYFIHTTGPDYRQGIISINKTLVQSEILLEADRTISITNSHCVSAAANGDNTNVGTFRDLVDGSSAIYSENVYYENREYGTVVVLPTNKPSRFAGGSFFAKRTDALSADIFQNGFSKFDKQSGFSGQNKPTLQVTAKDAGEKLLEIGQSNAAGQFQFGHIVSRSAADGWLEALGNQDLQFRGFRFNGEIELTTAGSGLILASPNGTRWRLTISNVGGVVVTAI